MNDRSLHYRTDFETRGYTTSTIFGYKYSLPFWRVTSCRYICYVVVDNFEYSVFLIGVRLPCDKIVVTKKIIIMNNRVNELADWYFHYIDELLDDALFWEIERNDGTQEFILEVKKALYTDLMLYTAAKLKEIKK